MNKLLLATVCATALILGSCDTASGPKQSLGTLLGAAAGGIAGAQIGSGKGQLAATGAGVFLGALLGNSVGASLDRADSLEAERTAQYALENLQDGHVSNWSNPNSGNSGTITPLNVYAPDANQYCREYQTTVTIGGETQSAHGTACRKPDGTWEVVG